MGVILRERENKKGTVSLYLDICYGKTRVREYLHFILNGDVKQDRKKRKLAEAIRAQREMQILSGIHNIVPVELKYTDFYSLIKIEKNSRYQNATDALKKFTGATELPCYKIDKQMCEGFLKYLKEKYTGTTPKDYFLAIRRIVKIAVREKHITEDPTELISTKGIKNVKLPMALTSDEIQTLFNTHCKIEAVKKVCLFISQTGIRLCDVRKLTWENFYDNSLTFKQSKSGINTVPLNENALALMGKPSEGLIFTGLPKDGKHINYTIKGWVKRAKIKKHITLHIFRHSFVTQIAKRNGVLIASRLAGHTTLRMTDRYSHLIENERLEAVNSLPSFFEKPIH